MSKRAIQRNQEITSYAAALELENRGQALLTRTADMPEALAAFKQKRAPRFTGKSARTDALGLDAGNEGEAGRVPRGARADTGRRHDPPDRRRALQPDLSRLRRLAPGCRPPPAPSAHSPGRPRHAPPGTPGRGAPAPGAR